MFSYETKINHLQLEKERLIQQNSGFNHSLIVNTIFKAYVLRELKINICTNE